MVPLIVDGWLGGISGGVVPSNAFEEAKDEDRDLSFVVVVVGDRLLASTLVPTSSSGKVMKKRQPKVVPKKAPSTV